MRFFEFCFESSTAGATISGNIAMVAKPIKKVKKSTIRTDFDDDQGIYSNKQEIALIRRNS